MDLIYYFMEKRFIVFEGIDGSGKSTQFRLFCDRLNKEGCRVWETLEPTKRNIGNVIRERLHAGAGMPGDWEGLVYGMLFYADRVEHNFDIKRELDAGKTVVSDRYYHSTLAYQRTQGLDMDFLLDLHGKLQQRGYVRKPDVTFFVDVPAEEAMKRIDARPRDKVDIFERTRFLKELRENYLTLKGALDERIDLIDGTGPVDEVHERLWSVYEQI